MSEIVYTPLTGKIAKYFSKIQEAGVPQKTNRSWLKTMGFSSSNDTHLLKILKALGFIDSTNVPTDLWKSYKNPQEAPAIMASAIRTAYSDLFGLYQDANRKDREADKKIRQPFCAYALCRVISYTTGTNKCKFC